MGQRLVKRDFCRGAKLYQEQRFEESIAVWQAVLRKATKSRDRFQVLGCVCQAQLNLGRVRDALLTAGLQFEIANAEKAAGLRYQAFYHMALCNERSSEFSKAASYCLCSLDSAAQLEQTMSEERPSKEVKVANPGGGGAAGGGGGAWRGAGGYVHLCLGNAYLGLSEFPKAWVSLAAALALAKDDKVLEVLVLCELGQLLCSLSDAESGLAYCRQAMAVLDSLPETSPSTQRHRRHVTSSLALPLICLGRYSEAMDHCEDALKAAMMYGDRPVQARCLFLFADTHRKRGDFERAYPRYQSAYSIMAEASDKLGQTRVLGGMAKTAAATGNLPQAIELNMQALELAKKIGNKLEMLRCHGRLQALYEERGESTPAHRNGSALRQLQIEMELDCGVCDEGLAGPSPDKLEPLPCGHFVHGRCAVHLARSTLGRSGKTRPCPACRRKSASNPVMYP